jgi:hypothetical protein
MLNKKSVLRFWFAGSNEPLELGIQHFVQKYTISVQNCLNTDNCKYVGGAKLWNVIDQI